MTAERRAINTLELAGIEHMRLGDLMQAEKDLSEAFTRRSAAFPEEPNHQSLLSSINNMAVLHLKQHRLECLPLFESSSSTALLHLLLPEQLLAFVAASPDLQTAAPALFNATLEQAVLPRCGAARTVGHTASLAEALALLASSERNVCALPVVDASGALVDVLSRRDVRHLASESHTDNLSTSVEQSLRSLPPSSAPRLHTCTPADAVGSAVSRLAHPEVGQLVCVDGAGAVHGIISSSDLIACFLDAHGGGGGGGRGAGLGGAGGGAAAAGGGAGPTAVPSVQ